MVNVAKQGTAVASKASIGTLTTLDEDTLGGASNTTTTTNILPLSLTPTRVEGGSYIDIAHTASTHTSAAGVIDVVVWARETEGSQAS